MTTQTTPSKVDEANVALEKAMGVVTLLEEKYTQAQADLQAAATTGDIAKITAAALLVVSLINSEDPTQGALPDARKDAEKAQAALKSAQFDIVWEKANGDVEAIRTLIKEAISDDLKAIIRASGVTSLRFVVDGFETETSGVNVNLAKGRGATSTLNEAGARASRGDAWVKGDETFSSSIEVLKAHGVDHTAAKGFNGLMNSKTYPATPEGWVTAKVEYAKDSSKLARDLGFKPASEVNPPAPEVPSVDAPESAPEAPEEAPKV